jgi:S-formylglutathione hydrolase FrmB
MRFRRFTGSFLTVLCIISFVLSGFGQQATKPARGGRFVELKIPAPSLKGNLLGDPTEQSIAIYLPPSYDTSPTKRYPTLYLLHGFTSSNNAFRTGLNLQPLMDQLINGGKIGEMILVLPNARNGYLGSFYVNSAVNGNWEDYIYKDLTQYVDANYRTLSKAESRGIAGHSMGGYGAMMLAMKHPDVFSVVYSLSPCCLGVEGDLTSENPAWLKTIRLTSKDELKTRPSSFIEFFQLAFVASSAAFSPNAARPPFFVDFLYREREGRLERDEGVFAKWKAKMPLYLVEENKGNLLRLRGIFLDYGEKEEFSHIRIAVGLFSKALSERNIPHAFEIYPNGDHNNRVRQRLETCVFPFFNERLDFEGSK